MYNSIFLSSKGATSSNAQLGMAENTELDKLHLKVI